MSYPQGIPTAKTAGPGAYIAQVEPDSPAARAGLMPGMRVLAVDGVPLGDILDWYWFTDELEIELEIVTPNGTENTEFQATSCPSASKHHTENTGQQEAGLPSVVTSVTLMRSYDESWGIEFSEVLFDGLRQCVNACSFCFMNMLPKGMRPALYARDDDYRLSFLHGNFVTLTNLSDVDIERIVYMQLSPLNVSLHASNPEVRELLMGKNHARGIQVLEKLLTAGIKVKAQIVLVPGVNDGDVLAETLDWIAERPGIMVTGIVPYGYTRFARNQQGFDTPESARAVINQTSRLAPQVQLADEFFIRAWPGEVLVHLPAADYYDDYPMREDGIGMVRQFVESNKAAELVAAASTGTLATGEAFAAVLSELLPNNQRIAAISNEFFGGNVDVAGLLTAGDILEQCRGVKEGSLLLPSAMFNDEGLTLDNKAATDIAAELNIQVKVLD